MKGRRGRRCLETGLKKEDSNGSGDAGKTRGTEDPGSTCQIPDVRQTVQSDLHTGTPAEPKEMI